jgi:hypothetical protein
VKGITRRALLAVPWPLVLAGLAPAWRLDNQGGGRCALACAGMAGAVEVPAERARLAAILRLGEVELATVAFAAIPARDGLDLLAFIAPDDTGLRLVGLEPFAGRTRDGTLFSSRVSTLGDGVHLRLARNTARRDPSGMWHREAWTDHLAWRHGTALADAAMRAPPPASWQARLTALRDAQDMALRTPCHTVSQALIAAMVESL